MENSKAVLVIEDDPSIRDVLAHNMGAEGYSVECVADGPQGLERALSGSHALVILDLNLPRLSGMAICKEIRKQNPALPLIMLTSRDAEVDRVVGLEAGADDYIVKPFSIHEFMARVRARLRVALSAQQGKTSAGLLSCGPLCLNLDKRIASIGENPIDLTRKEFDVLAFLMQQAPCTVTRAELLKSVWGTTGDVYEDAVTTIFGRLRRKLERQAPDFYFVRVVRGVGFRFSELQEISTPEATS